MKQQMEEKQQKKRKTNMNKNEMLLNKQLLREINDKRRTATRGGDGASEAGSLQ